MPRFGVAVTCICRSAGVEFLLDLSIKGVYSFYARGFPFSLLFGGAVVVQ